MRSAGVARGGRLLLHRAGPRVGAPGEEQARQLLFPPSGSELAGGVHQTHVCHRRSRFQRAYLPIRAPARHSTEHAVYTFTRIEGSRVETAQFRVRREREGFVENTRI